MRKFVPKVVRTLGVLALVCMAVLPSQVRATTKELYGPLMPVTISAMRRNARLSDSAATKEQQGWLRYKDQDYGFTLEYPAEKWTTETTIKQDYPFPAPYAVIKRQTFYGPGGMIDLDVWLSHNRNLNTWLKEYTTTRAFEGIFFDAEVAGHPAVIFFQEGPTSNMVATFFDDGRHVYRLWHTITSDEQAIEIYWHMLLSLALPGCRLGLTIIPGDAKRLVQRAVLDACVVLDSSCCGYYQSHNPFPCCNNRGNCTWWVYYKMGGVPFRGDAGTWWGQVPDYYPIWQRQTGIPPSGKRSIAAYVTGHPVYPNGHVSYVNSYWGGSKVTVSYMGWCVNCGTTKKISISEPTGYIFRKYEPVNIYPTARCVIGR